MEVPEVPDRFQLERHFSSDRTASIVYIRFIIPQGQTRPFLRHKVRWQPAEYVNGEEVYPTAADSEVDEGVDTTYVASIDMRPRHAGRKIKITVTTEGIQGEFSEVYTVSTAKSVYAGDDGWNPDRQAIGGRRKCLEDAKAQKQPSTKALASTVTEGRLECKSVTESSSEFHTYMKALYDLRGSLSIDADKIVLHALQSIGSGYLQDQTSLTSAMPEDAITTIFDFLTVQESCKIVRASKCVLKIMERMLVKREESLSSYQSKGIEVLSGEVETEVLLETMPRRYFDVVGLDKIDELDVQAPTLKYWMETSAKHPGVVRVHFDPEGKAHDVQVKVRGEMVKNGWFGLASRPPPAEEA